MFCVLKKLFNIDDKVEVSKEGGWINDFIAQIATEPESVQTVQGEDYYYWLDFDEPQEDLDKDALYMQAKILSRFLTKN